MKISQKAKMLVAGLAIVLAGAFAVSPVMAAGTNPCPANTLRGAATYTGADKNYTASVAECNIEDNNSNGGLMSTLNIVLNVIFGVIGFVAVIMLVFGGIQYTISAGDAGKVKKAKDTILYGVVGLIVSLLAAAIVNFVLAGVFAK